MSRILLLGPAREAAGRRHDEISGETVAEVLATAVERYGPSFAEILAVSRVWVNGSPAQAPDLIGPYDELAVLPPISGG